MVCSYDNFVGVNDCFHFGNTRIDSSVLHNENCTNRIVDNTLVALTPDDSRKSHRRERHNGKSHHQSYQEENLSMSMNMSRRKESRYTTTAPPSI